MTVVYIRLQTVWMLGIVGRTITLPSGFRLVFEPRVGISGKDSVGLYFKMPDLVDLEDRAETMDSKDEEAWLDSFHLAEHRQRLQDEHEAFSHENTPEDEQRLIHALEQADEQAGGILAFDLVPLQDRPCRHSNVRHRVFPAQLPEPNLASALPRHRLDNAPGRAFTEAIDGGRCNAVHHRSVIRSWSCLSIALS